MKPYGWLWLVFTIFVLGCSRSPTETFSNEPIFHDKNPKNLSDWNLLIQHKEALTLGQDVYPYNLATPLFTDYAHKLRTIWSPQGAATYRENEIIDFPVGTIITKTFYYPNDNDQTKNIVLKTANIDIVNSTHGLDLQKNRLLETRLLVHREHGWEPISYVWNEDQTDAILKRTGAITRLTLKDKDGKETPFAYVVPNINQCAGCHAPNNTTRTLTPIGPKGRNLNINYMYTDEPENQLEFFMKNGLLTQNPEKPNNPNSIAQWSDTSLSLNERARAYLDVNCAHCHNPVGPADTSGLHLNIENTSKPHLGTCKLAVAAGSGTGGRKFDIEPGNPDNSILAYRMASTNPAAMMPELGRSLSHKEGVTLINNWIAAMEGSCATG